jgi:hypothetical protein
MMKNFYLEATPKTPKLSFQSDTGYFEISGRSIPENSLEFYRPLMEWLDDYSSNPKSDTKMTIRLEYFNTSSSKCLVEIFRKLEKIHKSGNLTKVEWYYDEEDEDMQESGEDFKEIIKLPIEMIVIKEGEGE